jgi:HEAT repeat protein
LNATCDTRLSNTELADIVRRLTALSSDKDPSVRGEVARALGQIASAASVPALTALLSDPFKLDGSTVCSTTEGGPERCRPNWPVREQARTALETIAHVRTQERQQRP